MDHAMGTAIVEGISREGLRTTKPDDFPDLPELPIARYLDRGHYDREIDRLFRRTWLFAGHVSDVPDPGSYRVLDIPFAPLVMTRDRAGEVHVFVNACRHRGAPVVRCNQGTAKKLVCQFHSWVYDLDGSLTRVPAEEDFPPAIRQGRDLARVRCEVVNGFVFVNFDDDAEPLAEFLDPLVWRLGDLASADMVPVHRQSYDVQCNWKILVEAFLETYHVETIHSKTVALLMDANRTYSQLYRHGHSASFLPFKHVEAGGVEQGDTQWTTDLPGLPGTSEFYGHTYPTPLVFPNNIVAPDPAGYPIMTFWPVDVDRTRMEVHWYGVPWEGDRPGQWDARLAGFDVVTDEDLKNLEPMQRSLEAATHKTIPLCYREFRIWQFHVEMDRVMGAGDISPELAVADMLGDHVEP